MAEKTLPAHLCVIEILHLSLGSKSGKLALYLIFFKSAMPGASNFLAGKMNGGLILSLQFETIRERVCEQGEIVMLTAETLANLADALS